MKLSTKDAFSNEYNPMSPQYRLAEARQPHHIGKMLQKCSSTV